MSEVLRSIVEVMNYTAPASGVGFDGENDKIESLLHPAVAELSRLLDNSEFAGAYTRAEVEDKATERWLSLFRMQNELEARRNDPELQAAFDVWGQCKDARGLTGEKGEMVNSGVLHYFGYEATQKAGRFGDVSIQGFIDLSIHLRDAVTHPMETDYYARIPDGKGRAKWYAVSDGRLIVGFQHADEANPKVITAIPLGEDVKDIFFRKVSREVFSNKAIRRSNKLNGSSPVFEIGGQNYDAKNDILMPMPKSHMPKRDVVFGGVN